MDGLFPVAAPAKGNARGSGYVRNHHDWYVEPPWLVEQLLDAEEIIGDVWDPCCGLGTIPLVCRSRGLNAAGTDLVDRGFGQRLDFFRARDRRGDTIVSNPPFNRLEPFVHQALRLGARKVISVAEIGFLGGAIGRYRLFLDTPLKHVWIASSRATMPPGQMIGEFVPAGLGDGERLDAIRRACAKQKGTAMKFVWLVWDRAWPHPYAHTQLLPPHKPRAPRGEKLL